MRRMIFLRNVENAYSYAPYDTTDAELREAGYEYDGAFGRWYEPDADLWQVEGRRLKLSALVRRREWREERDAMLRRDPTEGTA